MPCLAKSPVAPVLGKYVPLRGPARLLFNSYARSRYQPQQCVTSTTTNVGDVFETDLSSTLEWQLWAFGHYEPHFAELFALLVRPGDRCVDVGANVGVHTVRLARLAGRDGAVIAVEPEPGLVRRAQRNILLNNLANVRLINAAASDCAGEMSLYRPDPEDTNRARASLLRHAYLTGDTITVPVVTVDDVCGDDRVTLIKIDVEGHEAAVVRGAARTIERDAPAVIFEYAPELLDDAAARSTFGWLAGRGYAMFAVHAARHTITGRVRLALDRVTERSAGCGNFLALSRAAAASLEGFQVPRR
jgi:FkbM family methyltransferase